MVLVDRYFGVLTGRGGACGRVRKRALWLVTVFGIFQENNLSHCARTESVSLLADHFTGLQKDSLTGHGESRCTKSTTGQHI